MQMYSFRRKLTLFCSSNGMRNFMGKSEKAKFIAWKGGTNNMTDSEKLDLLLQKAIVIETEMQSLRDDVDELKQDMKEVKADIIYLKTNQKELRRYSDIILDEIERVHGILDKHQKGKSVHTA